jgi:nitrogen fixation/metabolism regulation signal transduction histidine kinase
MLSRVQRLLRLDRLERRLFGWMLLLTLVPVFILLAGGYIVSARALQWVGSAGAWDRVAESGRALVEAAAPAAAADTGLARAVEAHREELSSSVLLARRWAFIGQRLESALPATIFTLALLLTAFALAVGRRLALQLARPIRELAGWADLLARAEPIPPERPAEGVEVREVRALRRAMRQAAVQLAEGRARDLDAERVRAWGEMARRVAHEMKNPLSPLRLAAHRLARHPAAATELREPIEVIEEEVARLEELARQFAVLGRPSAGPASDVDVRELLESLLASDVPSSIATRLAVAPGVGLVRAHYDALQRAFRNVIRNAVEAMTATDGQREHLLSVTVDVNGAALRIAFADTGAGIPPDSGERLFEPDFTLKAGGTGLGLAVVRQAVAAHGGTVYARNRPGGGAEFTLVLPLAGAPIERAGG